MTTSGESGFPMTLKDAASNLGSDLWNWTGSFSPTALFTAYATAKDDIGRAENEGRADAGLAASWRAEADAAFDAQDVLALQGLSDKARTSRSGGYYTGTVGSEAEQAARDAANALRDSASGALKAAWDEVPGWAVAVVVVVGVAWVYSLVK